MFGEALLKTTGLCVDLSSYNRKVLCLHKEDFLIRFNIVAGSDVPLTNGQIVVLPEVTRGNQLIFVLLPVSFNSGKKFNWLMVMQDENVPEGVMTSQP